ncbi:MAG: conjugative transposon protein TraM [Endomicrobium sp.]|nr:conjugative transposon protein TraM [Endomicrobium sp.]
MNSEEETTNGAIPPLLNTKDSLTYKDMLGVNNTNTNEYTSHTKDSADIKSQIADLYGVGEQNKNSVNNNSSGQERSDYDPYGSREMYTVPKINYSRSADDYNSASYESSKEPEQEEHVPYSYSAPDKVSDKIYSAQLLGELKKNHYLTPENPKVTIMTLEDIIVSGTRVPKGSYLVAYASFNREIKLTIKQIKVGKKVITTDIECLDAQGQSAIQLVGGTKEMIQDEASNIVQDETETGNKVIDKAVKLVTKRKTKVRLNSSYIYLKINK